jgi:hypothetical protein
MNKRVEALIEEARKLSAEERAELLARLPAELDDEGNADGTPEEIEAAWVDEVEHRVEGFERGETTSVDLDDVLADARKRIAGR